MKTTFHLLTCHQWDYTPAPQLGELGLLISMPIKLQQVHDCPSHSGKKYSLTLICQITMGFHCCHFGAAYWPFSTEPPEVNMFTSPTEAITSPHQETIILAPITEPTWHGLPPELSASYVHPGFYPQGWPVVYSSRYSPLIPVLCKQVRASQGQPHPKWLKLRWPQNSRHSIQVLKLWLAEDGHHTRASCSHSHATSRESHTSFDTSNINDR